MSEALRRPHMKSRSRPTPLPLVDALPELMTPASAALGVPCLVEPGEGGQGRRANQQSAVVLGVPKGIR